MPEDSENVLREESREPVLWLVMLVSAGRLWARRCSTAAATFPWRFSAAAAALEAEEDRRVCAVVKQQEDGWRRSVRIWISMQFRSFCIFSGFRLLSPQPLILKKVQQEEDDEEAAYCSTTPRPDEEGPSVNSTPAMRSPGPSEASREFESGGSWWWSPPSDDIELRITGYSQRHIDAIIRFAAGLPEWRYTGFYGKFWLAYGLPWGCSRGTILLDWLKDKFDSLTTFELTHFITICWGIWNARNKNIWNKVDSLPKLVVQHSLSYLKEWKSVRTPPLSAICSQRNQVKWVKPSNGFLKLNIDASVHSDTSHVGMGWILRDQDGYFVAAQTETRPSPLLPREAEALAIREALSWLKDHQ
nr:uncharacterized protein LOC109159918 [Ipomoea batatas]